MYLIIPSHYSNRYWKKAEVAASAPLPQSDSENYDTSSSTKEQIDELAKLSPKSPQNLGERKESPGLPPYDVRGIPVTLTSTEFASPDIEIIVRGAAGVTVSDTLLHFANYLSHGQVINAVDGGNETDEELEESVVEEDNTSNDSETDEMAESNWSPRHFSGTAIEDADVWMRQFINCCEYKEYGDNKKLALMKVLLTGRAATWLESLTAAQTDTWQHLHDVFKTRYTAPSFMKFK